MILHYSHHIHQPVFRLTYLHFARKKLKAYGVFASSGNFYTELVHQRLSWIGGYQICGRTLYTHIHRLAWNNLLIKL
jgi:hypothetical protein